MTARFMRLTVKFVCPLNFHRMQFPIAGETEGFLVERAITHFFV